MGRVSVIFLVPNCILSDESELARRSRRTISHSMALSTARFWIADCARESNRRGDLSQATQLAVAHDARGA